MYSTKGITYTVKELMELLGQLPGETPITAAGGVLHVITKTDEKGNYEGVVIEDNDYAEEWNEEFGYTNKGGN